MIEVPIVEFDINIASRVGALDSLHDFAVLVSLPNLAMRAEFESQFTYARELFHEVFSSDPIKTKYPMLFLTQRAPGHSPIGPSLHADLVEANRRQLLDSGVSPRAIQIVGGCTVCQGDLFFSHRASQGHAGRMMAVIGIREAGKARPGRADRK